jgi:AraC-like DNA-binding protein/mannose-6-phosphate isomerase-like protein (cupin superfamily)
MKTPVKSFNIEVPETSDIQFTIMDMKDFFPHFNDSLVHPHIHNFYQIIWFRKGTGKHMVDFKEYPVAPDTIFFISSGQVHYFDGKTDYEGVVIHFNESFLSDEDNSENVFLKYNVFNAFDTVPYFNVSPDDTPKLGRLVGEMMNEAGNTGGFAHRDYLQYLLKLFLICIQRNGRRGNGEPLCINNAGNRMFVRFRQLLEKNYRQLHTVKEYASALNVSSRTLTACIRENANSTPLALIDDRIILEAKRLLRYSSLRVKEIGYELGFDDPSYFVKFFKHRTGMLPQTFRGVEPEGAQTSTD